MQQNFSKGLNSVIVQEENFSSKNVYMTKRGYFSESVNVPPPPLRKLGFLVVGASRVGARGFGPLGKIVVGRP